MLSNLKVHIPNFAHDWFVSWAKQQEVCAGMAPVLHHNGQPIIRVRPFAEPKSVENDC